MSTLSFFNYEIIKPNYTFSIWVIPPIYFINSGLLNVFLNFSPGFKKHTLLGQVKLKTELNSIKTLKNTAMLFQMCFLIKTFLMITQ